MKCKPSADLSILNPDRVLLLRGTYGACDDRTHFSVARQQRSVCPPVFLAIRKSPLRVARLSANFAKSDRAMKLLFWLCLVLITYTYFGYAVWLWLLSVYEDVRFSKVRSPQACLSLLQRATRKRASPPNSKIFATSTIRRNSFRLSLPPTDQRIAPGISSAIRANRVVPVILDESNGKAFALNEAVKRATGDILVFLDARQTIDANAVSELVACFADPEVGRGQRRAIARIRSRHVIRKCTRHLLEDRKDCTQTRVCVWFGNWRNWRHLCHST